MVLPARTKEPSLEYYWRIASASYGEIYMQLTASLSRATALVLPLASLFLFTGCNCGPEHTDGDGSVTTAS